jgi:hypothetical protein
MLLLSSNLKKFLRDATHFLCLGPYNNGTRAVSIFQVDITDYIKLQTTKDMLPPEAGCSKQSFLKICCLSFLVKIMKFTLKISPEVEP